MPCVEFRVHKGRLEYRTLILKEIEIETSGGNNNTYLVNTGYTEWSKVPIWSD